MDQGLAGEIWGESEAVLALKSRLSRAAKVNRPVLLAGERGTGKELAAARLHYLSPRWQGPYLTLNCAALSPGLVESELFGHEADAYTGAKRARPGRFEAAEGGTLFLDEISRLSLEAQAKILRVVEYGTFQRLGNPREMRVDVRLVSATNVDLKARAAADEFLPDLLDRLSFEVIVLPPLREREGDVLRLAHLFAARMAGELGLAQAPTFSPAAAAALTGHDWPGNVRELKNTVERAVYRRPGGLLDEGDLELGLASMAGLGPDADQANPSRAVSGHAGPEPSPSAAALELPLAKGQFDRLWADFALELFQAALARARHNQREAARLLGLTYHRFRFLYKKFSCSSAATKPKDVSGPDF